MHCCNSLDTKAGSLNMFGAFGLYMVAYAYTHGWHGLELHVEGMPLESATPAPKADSKDHNLVHWG